MTPGLVAAVVMRLLQCVIIAGPTGVGKSQLALELAAIVGGIEIVSIDAYQAYRGLEVLSAAPTPAMRRQVPHHLVSCIDIGVELDAASFGRNARRVITEINQRGRTALLVGGSGLYLGAVFGTVSGMPAADHELRASLDALTTGELLAELDRRDPIAGSKIDRNNRRRIIRALEVCRLTGRAYSSMRSDWSGGASARDQQYPPAVLVTRPMPELAERIAARTRAMLDNGAIEEVQHAGELSSTAARTLGVDQIHGLLAGKITLGECCQQIAIATRRYAKRQLTWFRNRTTFPELDLSGASTRESALKICRLLGLQAKPEA